MDLAGLDSGTLLARLGIALGLGLLIGLEREYTQEPSRKPRAAGLRTHALIALLGASVSFLSDLAGSLMLPVTMALLGGLVITSYVLLWLRSDEEASGITSETVILLTFILGALVAYGRTREAVVVTGATCVILSAKRPLHRFVGTLSDEEWRAAMKFAVISLVVLPVLPNENLGPFGSFNPFKIWLLVVMISGIGFLGYVLSRSVGATKGVVLTGLVGGLASSTAVTLANARRCRETPGLVESLSLSTMLACTVKQLRSVVILAAVAPPSVLRATGIALAAMTLAMGADAYLLYRRSLGESGADDDPSDADDDDDDGDQDAADDAGDEPERSALSNPFELGPALEFGAAFALIGWLVAWTRHAGAGAWGLYLLSFFSGMAKTDAIVLSLGQQARDEGGVPVAAAVTGIVLAMAGSNLLKIGVAWISGGWQHGSRVLIGLLLGSLAGLAAVALMQPMMQG